LPQILHDTMSVNRYLSCSAQEKATLLLGWSHRYKYSTVIITIVTKYPYLKWQCILYFYVDVSFLYYYLDFYLTWVCIRVTLWVSYRKQELRTLREHLSSSLVLWRVPCCSSLYFFCVVLLCVFPFWVPFCNVPCGSSLPPVVCRSAHVLFTLFVFACV
jgi:hypothetical protein